VPQRGHVMLPPGLVSRCISSLGRLIRPSI
jgi:hypothetical protein